ncbi:hypothetical protein [Cohnella terricola]|uniref:hypothetical protein n=1 Tax=Cohnella terricola TaxID=1289167 RepID=UPI001646D2C0|nr:hypothetical protein [Cohnella terricola]
MKPSEFVKKVILNFLVIFASIIIVLTFLRQLFYPDMPFDLKSIYIIMGFSLISAGVGLILNPPLHISERNMRIRLTLHFLALETILISLAAIFGIVENVVNILVLALEIAVIYAVVRLLSWRNDMKAAEQNDFAASGKFYEIPILNLYSDDVWKQLGRNSTYAANDEVDQSFKEAYTVHFQGAKHLSLTDLPLFSPLLANMLQGGKATIDPYYCIETENELILKFFDYTLKGIGRFTSEDTY